METEWRIYAWSAPSHYLNQRWNIVNWTIGNQLQWNLNRNLYIAIQENSFENIAWKMAAILSRPQCVNVLFNNVIECNRYYINMKWTVYGSL